MQFLFTVLAAAFSSVLLGYIWYNPKVFGAIWMREADVTEEKIKSSNMPLIIGLFFLFSAFVALLLFPMVVHQVHLYSIFANLPDAKDPSTEIGTYFKDFMDKYGHSYRTFKHGMFHGALVGLLFVSPIIAINALFERRSYRYILVHAGYWILNLMIMGGIICQFAVM